MKCKYNLLLFLEFIVFLESKNVANEETVSVNCLLNFLMLRGQGGRHQDFLEIEFLVVSKSFFNHLP